MSTFPAVGYLTNSARNEGEGRTANEEWLAATKQIAGSGVAETSVTISGDAVTLPGGSGGIFSVDTEGGAGSDDLKNIVQTNFPDGSIIFLRCVSASRIVKLWHSAGGAGQITLTTGGDCTLGSPSHWIVLKRTGTTWEELWRHPAAELAPILSKTDNYVTVAGDRGRLIEMTAATAKTITLLSAASAGKGFLQFVRNSGSAYCAIDPNASELIDATGAVDIQPGGATLIVCDGAAWKTLARYQPLVTYYTSTGQDSKNNAAAPNTKVDLIAGTLVLWDKGKRNPVVIETPGTITLDKALDYTNANGRDQSAAFSNSSWVHAYWVWNSAVGLRGRLSVNAPPTGPAFVSGEDWWAYAGPWRIDGSGNFLKQRIKGAWVSYESPPLFVSSGSATAETSSSYTSLVPTNAMMVNVYGNHSFTHSAAQSNTVVLRLATGVDWAYNALSVQVASGTDLWTGHLLAPNLQSLYYHWSVAVGTRSANLAIAGYEVPNNGS